MIENQIVPLNSVETEFSQMPDLVCDNNVFNGEVFAGTPHHTVLGWTQVDFCPFTRERGRLVAFALFAGLTSRCPLVFYSSNKKGKYTLHAQGKMTNTMTMQEQIEMSGLEIMSSLSSSSSSSLSSQLQWNSTNQWSPLLGGGRDLQACVTIESGNENGEGGQSIVVIGGRMQNDSYTNSVIVWDPSTKRWRNGPSLNDRRRDLVAVVCRDKVYAIGGLGHANNYHGSTTLDTIESIQVSSLLEMTETSTMTRQNNNQWTRLQCRLSSPRMKFAAVVVHNHYIVILGGYDTILGQDLSSVDIIDTAPPQNNNNNNGEPTIVAGPSMNSTRSSFGAAVVDNWIFVVGGWVNSMRSTSVESLLFQQQPQDKDKDHTNSNSNVSCTFANSSWRMEPHLSLSSPRAAHAVAKMGSCLVVAGGYCNNHGSSTYTSVEVLDFQRAIVWSLPNLNIQRLSGCSMVTLSDCLLVLGGNDSVDSVESLALTVYQKHERCFKFLKFLIEIEFLGQPTRKRDV